MSEDAGDVVKKSRLLVVSGAILGCSLLTLGLGFYVQTVYDVDLLEGMEDLNAEPADPPAQTNWPLQLVYALIPVVLGIHAAKKDLPAARAASVCFCLSTFGGMGTIVVALASQVTITAMVPQAEALRDCSGSLCPIDQMPAGVDCLVYRTWPDQYEPEDSKWKSQFDVNTCMWDEQKEPTRVTRLFLDCGETTSAELPITVRRMRASNSSVDAISKHTAPVASFAIPRLEVAELAAFFTLSCGTAGKAKVLMLKFFSQMKKRVGKFLGSTQGSGVRRLSQPVLIPTFPLEQCKVDMQSVASYDKLIESMLSIADAVSPLLIVFILIRSLETLLFAIAFYLSCSLSRQAGRQ